MAQLQTKSTVSYAGQPAPDTGARNSHVQQEMLRKSHLIDDLAKQASMLEQRLEPILRDNNSVEGPDATKERIALVGHAMAISNQNDQLERLSSQLESIINRIEL